MDQLKKRLARGETEAFVELYDLLGDRLQRYLSARLGRTDAQDVLQEVFVRLVRYHRQLGKSRNLTAYVFLTARNESNRWVRKRQNESTTQLDASQSRISNTTTPIENQIEKQELATMLLNRLSSESREIVQLKIYSQLTFAEIATILQLPDATVATKYRRTVAKMQSWLDTQRPSTKLKNT